MNEQDQGDTAKYGLIDTVEAQQGFSQAPALPSAVTVLKKLRTKHGFDSPIGRRCSNILEIMDQMPRPPEDWIDYLMPDYVPVQYAHCVREIERQTADLHKLLAA